MTLPLALAGVRVVDFTWVRAGPWATRWLGAFGADIIKIEWPEHLDILRTNRNTIPPGMEPGPNVPGQFADTNVNKLGLTINVRSPRGLELIKRLIAIADVVIENFSSRVMRNWGIGYDVMQQLKPDIIYVSMAGFGHTGPHHHYTTMGPSAQALSGQTFLSGLPGTRPAGWGWSYLDDTGGMYGAMCVLTALHHRNATGQGQHVDLSQMTAGITLTGPAFLGHSVRYGAVKAGKAADLLILDANPLRDIAATRALRGVVIGGKFMDRAALDNLLAAARTKAVAKTLLDAKR